MKKLTKLLRTRGACSPQLPRYLMSLLLLLAFMVVGNNKAWADEVVSESKTWTVTAGESGAKTGTLSDGTNDDTNGKTGTLGLYSVNGVHSGGYLKLNAGTTAEVYFNIPANTSGTLVVTYACASTSSATFSVKLGDTQVYSNNTSGSDATNSINSGAIAINNTTASTARISFLATTKEYRITKIQWTVGDVPDTPSVESIKSVEGTTTTWNFEGLTADHLTNMKAQSPAWEADGEKTVKIPTVSQATYWTPSWCEGIRIGANQSANGEKVRLYASDGSYPGFYLGGGAASMFVTIPAGANTLTVTSSTSIRSNTSGVTFTLKDGTTDVYVATVTEGMTVEIRRASDGGSNSIKKVVTSYIEPPLYTVTFNPTSPLQSTVTSLTEPVGGSGIFLPVAYKSATDITNGSGMTLGTWQHGGTITIEGEYDNGHNPKCREVFYGTSHYSTCPEDGKVIYHTLNNLAKGTYELCLGVGASSTAGRGDGDPSDAVTGDDLTKVYAGDKEMFIPVKPRTAVAVGEENVVVFTIEIPEEGGSIEYGLKNVKKSGNWYILQRKSFKKIDTEAAHEWYLTEESQGAAGTLYNPTADVTLTSSVSSDATLRAIGTRNGGKITPAFAPDKHIYTVNQTLTVENAWTTNAQGYSSQATPTNAFATVPSITRDSGHGTQTITVRAEDGTNGYYQGIFFAPNGWSETVEYTAEGVDLHTGESINIGGQDYYTVGIENRTMNQRFVVASNSTWLHNSTYPWLYLYDYGARNVALLNCLKGQIITIGADAEFTPTGATFVGSEAASPATLYRYFVTQSGNIVFSVPRYQSIKSLAINNGPTISFNTNGGNEIADANIMDVNELPTPVKENFTFVGWCTDAELTTPVANPFTPIANTTLYAKWTENLGGVRLTGDACNTTGTLLKAGGSSENLRFTLADRLNGALTPEGLVISDFEWELTGDDVVTINNAVIDGNKKLYFTITPKSTTGTATLNVRFKGNAQYSAIDATPVTITVVNPVTVTYSVGSGGSVAAKAYNNKVDVASGNSIPTQNVTFTATPATGYLFDNWTIDQEVVSTENPYVRTVDANINLKANFIESRIISVAVATGSEGMGTVALYARDTQDPNLSGVEIKQNVNLDIVATVTGENHFLGWRTNNEGTGEFVSTDAKFQKKAQDIATNTTYYAYFSAVVVDPTKVGAEDNSTPYAGAHSQVYPLAQGKTRHIEFVNHSDKAQNWDNWILSVGSTEANAVPENAEDPADLMMLRADNWDIIEKSQTASAFNWSTFKNDMDGATVVMDVTNSGKHIYVNATITTTTSKVYKYSAICNDRSDAGTDAYFCFTVEKSHITNLNVGDEAQAYELTYAMNEFGTDNYNDSYGNVTIKNAQGLPLRKGTYAPTGEVVTYKAENKATPSHVFLKWASGYTAAQRDITVATAAVNPCAQFLGKPGVSTHENIVTLTHPANGTSGFKMYYTLDQSDPATSATRIEYAPNSVAIREGMTKVRAIAYIDGVYSVIQGQGVTYEHVTVLEARGTKVAAHGTFTNSTCTSSVEIKNDFSGNPGAISPNSQIEASEKPLRSNSFKTATIQLTSTSASKIVVAASSSSSDVRSLTSVYVDGVQLTPNTDYTISGTNNGTVRQNIGDRIVITLKQEISQNSDVTFNFNNNVNFIYFEAFGTSKNDFCEMPEVAPDSYNSTDNLWSYTLTPATGTTMKYVVVDLSKGEPLAGYPKESTSVVTISKSTESNLKAGLMIRAWSVDPAGIKVASEKAFITVESLLSPVLKYNIKEAKYNKDGVAGYITAEPVFTVYPSSMLPRVTFTTDDETVGYANTSDKTLVTIGSGQGVTTIKASLIIGDEESANGFKAGEYTTSLKLVVSDGIAYALSENEKGTKPKIRTEIEIRDPQNNDLLLTMMYGGYKYKNGQFNGEQAEDSKTHEMKDVFDSWGSVEKFSGYGDGLVDSKKYVDGYGYNSQAQRDARSEAMAQDMAKGGSKVWFETTEQKPDGSFYQKYERIKPFSLPVRGAYFTFEPQENGVLTLYVLQNGSLNTNRPTEGANKDKDFVTSLSDNPRTYYWFDQDGYRIEPTSVTVKQPLTFGTDATDIEGHTTWQSKINDWKNLSEYSSDIDFKTALDSWGTQTQVQENLEKSEPDPQPIIPFQKGYCLLQKAYVKYVVNVVAGKTYYFFSNNSKLGFAGVNFKKADVADVNVSNSDLTMTQTDNVNTITKNTLYKRATLSRTLKKDTWNTITLPFALSERQVEKVFGYGTKVVLYNGTTGTDQSLKVYFLEHVDQNILPGQPYFILPTGVDKNGNDIASVGDGKIGQNGGLVFENIFVPSNVALQSYGNNTHATDGDRLGDRNDFTFEGTFAPTSVRTNDYYLNANTGDLVQNTSSAFNLNTYRAYLKAVNPQSAKRITGVAFGSVIDEEDFGDDVVTSIMNVLVNEMNVEIAPVDGVYNLSGQKIADSTKNLPKGIYIVNGKKISINR